MKDYARIASINITHQKKRSWLTIIGIIIGIAAIVSLITIGQGMNNAIEEQFEKLGSNRIFVMPKGFQGPGSGSPSFTDEDVKAVQRAQGVEYITPIITGIVQVDFKSQNSFLYTYAYRAEKVTSAFEDMGFEIESGRNFRKNEKGSLVLGSKIAENAFEKEVRVNHKLTLNNHDFRVVGILEETGQSDYDNMLFLTIEDAKKVLDTEKYNLLFVIIKKGLDIEDVRDDVEKEMERVRDSENFDVSTSKQVLEQINNILGIVQLILVGIAAISLLVGGIGIMNTMYTSVLEKTRDIGIMKAIGASNHAILSIFMIESGFLGAIGGIIGAAVGSGLALFVGEASKYASLPIPIKIIIDPYIIAFAIAFAFVIGLVSGALPARNAAKLKPVEALRYE